MNIDVNSILFRASSFSQIMTGVAKGWSVENSQTCKKKLVQMYREIVWKRYSNKSNKYTEKGKLAESSGIDLYCLVKGRFYRKNEERKTNLYFTGEWDLDDGNGKGADETIDIKCSWDATTFPSFLDKPDDGYEYQGEVYMNLTGAKKHTIAHCLVNTPASIILQAKRKLSFDYGIIDTETEEYIEACKQLEINSIFDIEAFERDYPYFDFHIAKKDWNYDIPRNERIYETSELKNETRLLSMQSRVLESRAWMKKNLFKTIN